MAKTVLYGILGLGALIILYRILQSSGLLDAAPKKWTGSSFGSPTGAVAQADTSFIDKEIVGPVLAPIGEAEAGLFSAIKDAVTTIFPYTPAGWIAAAFKGSPSQGGPVGGNGVDVSQLVGSYNPLIAPIGVQQKLS